jgi:hypothetical protein
MMAALRMGNHRRLRNHLDRSGRTHGYCVIPNSTLVTVRYIVNASIDKYLILRVSCGRASLNPFVSIFVLLTFVVSTAFPPIAMRDIGRHGRQGCFALQHPFGEPMKPFIKSLPA